MNHFLHRDRDENIECKAYFAEFGQSECVYFTINKTSNEHVFIYKNMVPMLYKYVKYLNKVFTLPIRHINLTYIGVARGAGA